MKVGILGLGLIGGSMAKAYTGAGHTVLAFDPDETILSFAKLSGAVRETLTREALFGCELILLAAYPQACIAWLEENADCISPAALVVDLGGIKSELCRRCFPIAEEHGFTFVGGHPMAGSQFSGFKYSRADLFQGAPMVLVPPVLDDMAMLDRVKQALSPCGFGSYCAATAQEHDRIIAFTSQMPHVLSNAFVKSPTAARHRGFSAGSYRDLTRVAWLNPQMWAELFLENRDNLLLELDTYLENLTAYRDALAKSDRAVLIRLLQEGRDQKQEVDG